MSLTIDQELYDYGDELKDEGDRILKHLVDYPAGLEVTIGIINSALLRYQKALGVYDAADKVGE